MIFWVKDHRHGRRTVTSMLTILVMAKTSTEMDVAVLPDAVGLAVLSALG